MLSHFKRRLGALAAVAVLAALVPTVTSTPTASAAPATTAITALTIGGSLTRTATYKACPTGAASAAGFTDTTAAAVEHISELTEQISPSLVKADVVKQTAVRATRAMLRVLGT